MSDTASREQVLRELEQVVKERSEVLKEKQRVLAEIERLKRPPEPNLTSSRRPGRR